MSVTQSVFVNRKKIPSARDWAAAIQKSGFPISLSTDVDLETHSGFLPCKLKKQATGFEYFLEQTAEADLDAAMRKRAKAFDSVTHFVTHSELSGLAVAAAAAAVLAQMTDGLYWSDEAGEFFETAEALDFARGYVADVDRPPPPKPTLVVPTIKKVRIEARVGFWGAGLIMFEAQGEPPLRCTARLSTTGMKKTETVTICALWEALPLEATVRGFEVSGVPVWLNSIGEVEQG